MWKLKTICLLNVQMTLTSLILFILTTIRQGQLTIEQENFQSVRFAYKRNLHAAFYRKIV